METTIMIRYIYISLLCMVMITVTTPESAGYFLGLTFPLVIFAFYKSASITWERGRRLWIFTWIGACLGLLAHVVCFIWIARQREEFLPAMKQANAWVMAGAVAGILIRMYYTSRLDPEKGFVRTGPFRFCAHPMYATMLVTDLPFWQIADARLAAIGGAAWIAMILTMYLEEKEFFEERPAMAARYFDRTLSVHRIIFWWRRSQGLQIQP